MKCSTIEQDDAAEIITNFQNVCYDTDNYNDLCENSKEFDCFLFIFSPEISMESLWTKIYEWHALMQNLMGCGG